jgi:hypothetical protein
MAVEGPVHDLEIVGDEELVEVELDHSRVHSFKTTASSRSGHVGGYG